MVKYVTQWGRSKVSPFSLAPFFGGRPFVKEIHIRNFRCFPAANDKNDDFKISFNIPKDNKPGSGLTVLIGENNSGKSTVLRAIRLFSCNEKYLDNMLARHELHASCVDDMKAGAEIRLHTTSGIECSLKSINDDEKLQWECDDEPFKKKFKCQKIGTLVNTDWFSAEILNNDVINDFMYGLSSFAPECQEAETLFGTMLKQGNPRDGKNYPVEKTSCGREIPARQLGSGDLQFRHITNAVKNNYKSSEKESSEKEDACRIFLLDEPETHLHPKAIQALIDMLWEEAKTIQIIITSHSPVLVEAVCNKAKEESDIRNRVSEPKHNRKPEDSFRILSKDTETHIIRSRSAKPFLLNPVSADEINYCAFDCISENYFVQLYDTLAYKWEPLYRKEKLTQKEKSTQEKPFTQKDMDEMFNRSGCQSDQKATIKKQGKDKDIEETIFTYQRNALAHPTNKSRTFKADQLKFCVEAIRNFLSEADAEEVSSSEESTASSQVSR